MRFHLTFLMVFMACSLLAGVVQSAVLPDEAENDVLVPTSGWLVGPASLLQLKDGGEGMPCVAMNQFANGGSLRVSGGDQAVLAMALDFHAPVFKSGENYEVSVSLPPSYLRPFKGVAYNSSTMIISVAEPEEFYKQVLTARNMVVTVDRQTMSMALLGLNDGLSRLESCYSKKSDSIKTAAAQPMKTYKMKNPQVVPGDSLPDAKIVEAASQATPQQDMVEEMPAPGFMPDTAKTAQVPNRFHVSDFLKTEVPVAKAEDKAIRTEGQLAKAWTENDVKDEKKDPTPSSNNEKKSAQIWAVNSEASLHETLDSWADRSGVVLVWKAGRDYKIPQNLTFEGPFETAVLGILSQYGGNNRPLGRLYRDPSVSSSVLLIESE